MNGDGMEQWCEWLSGKVKEKKEALMMNASV